MAKFCIYCGKPLIGGSKFCMECGKPVHSGTAAQTEAHREAAPAAPAPTVQTPATVRTAPAQTPAQPVQSARTAAPAQTPAAPVTAAPVKTTPAAPQTPAAPAKATPAAPAAPAKKTPTKPAAPAKKAKPEQKAPAKAAPAAAAKAAPAAPAQSAAQPAPNAAPRGFWGQLLAELQELLRHPKKLLPTIVLTVVWTVFSLMSTFGVNIPVFRTLYTLTYANGGMFGGLLGAVGGIFGKAVFAGVVNTLVLAVFEKKNPFAGSGKALTGVVGDAARSGVSAVSPFLLGAGAGLLLYWLFNITASPVNCAVAVVSAVGALSALGKKGGLLTSLIFSVLKRASRGKTPSQVTVNRVLAGFSAGFVIGLPLTFVRIGWVLLLVGVLLTAAGIALPTALKNGARKAAAALALLLAVGLVAPFGAKAFGNTYEMKIDGRKAETDDGFGSLGGIEGALYYCFWNAGTITVEDGTSFSLPAYGGQGIKDTGIAGASAGGMSFSGTRFTQRKSDYQAVFTLNAPVTVTLVGYDWSNTDITYTSDINISSMTVTMQIFDTAYDADAKTARMSVQLDYSGTAVSRESGEKEAFEKRSFLNFDAADLSIAGGEEEPTSKPTSKPESKPDKEPEQDEEDAPKPYRGYLTYTNGRVNKYGQPFPDLMDFDGDGEITWLDVNIQKELSHDPDWLDRPMSKEMGALLAILTGLLGGAGGLVGGIAGGLLGGAAGGAAEAAAEAAAQAAAEGLGDLLRQEEDAPEKPFDLGPYIQRDADGDLNVKDPATGEQRLYVANGDGTYTNPLTGATYTERELKDSLDSRAENAGLIRQDEAAGKRAVEEQRAENQGKSWITEKLEAEERARLAAEAAEADHRRYIDSLADKHGVYSGDADLYGRIGQKQGEAEVAGYEYREWEHELEQKQTYVENVKKGADIAIDVGAELDPTGTGKKIKDFYTVGTSAAGNLSEALTGQKSWGGAIVQTAVESTVGLAKNHAGDSKWNLTGTGNYAEKAVVNIVGDGVSATTNELAKGASLEEARKAGSAAGAQGLVNTLVDAGMDGLGGKFGSDSKDAIGTLMGTTVNKSGATEATKALVGDLVKDGLAPADQEAEALKQGYADWNRSEQDANADAAERFRRAQAQWRENAGQSEDQ